MSDFFSAADLTELRTVAQSAMAGTLIIKRQTRSGDGMGGFSTTYPAVGTVTAHVWRTREADERVTGGMVQSKVEWNVAVPFGTDIREIDYAEYNGLTTLQIVHVEKPTTWQAQVMCGAVTYNRELRDDGV